MQVFVRDIYGRVIAVLDLHPIFRSSGAIGAIGALRHHAFKSHVARGTVNHPDGKVVFLRDDEQGVNCPRRSVAQDHEQAVIA